MKVYVDYVNTERFNKALAAYAKASGMGINKCVEQQGRLLSERLLKLTPPKKGLSEGRKRVDGDIRRVFADLGRYRWEDSESQELWERGEITKLKAKYAGNPRKEDMLLFRYQTIFRSPVKGIHESARRRGAVPKKWVSLFGVSQSKNLRKYIKARQGKVGIAKSGWLAAVRALGGRAPTWVSRHGEALGEFERKREKGGLFLRIVNAVSTFPEGLKDSILRNAIGYGARAMEKNTLRILRGEAFKFKGK